MPEINNSIHNSNTGHAACRYGADGRNTFAEHHPHVLTVEEIIETSETLTQPAETPEAVQAAAGSWKTLFADKIMAEAAWSSTELRTLLIYIFDIDIDGIPELYIFPASSGDHGDSGGFYPIEAAPITPNVDGYYVQNPRAYATSLFTIRDGALEEVEIDDRSSFWSSGEYALSVLGASDFFSSTPDYAGGFSDGAYAVRDRRTQEGFFLLKWTPNEGLVNYEMQFARLSMDGGRLTQIYLSLVPINAFV